MSISIYTKLIIKATGCTEKDAEHIEDIMRDDIFHSTLDWVPAPEFDKAAKDAAELLPHYQQAGLI